VAPLAPALAAASVAVLVARQAAAVALPVAAASLVAPVAAAALGVAGEEPALLAPLAAREDARPADARARSSVVRNSTTCRPHRWVAFRRRAAMARRFVWPAASH
jgi:hypothetical protein